MSKLTKPQIEALGRFDERGLYSPREYNYKPKTRMLEKMATMGLVTHYRHGGFEITDAGKEALRNSRPCAHYNSTVNGKCNDCGYQWGGNE